MECELASAFIDDHPIASLTPLLILFFTDNVLGSCQHPCAAPAVRKSMEKFHRASDTHPGPVEARHYFCAAYPYTGAVFMIRRCCTPDDDRRQATYHRRRPRENILPSAVSAAAAKVSVDTLHQQHGIELEHSPKKYG